MASNSGCVDVHRYYRRNRTLTRCYFGSEVRQEMSAAVAYSWTLTNFECYK